ncbi:hypothetical protein HPB52_015225 [Rhipicephalus sanguineus]|uniref:Uncharacterized protein n=1 Tax=Rhipicephalus sanguineus TaxID=34632 RepID=A0A9D4PMM9_RHISA|nr:hypothetical protein HPB52_015225 [Rhipicephalus sanguineus]
MENISAEREQPSLAAIAEETGDTTCIAHQGDVERCLPVCTASEAQVCQIAHFLSMCNELLFDMCLQLREQPGGSLSLVSFEPTDIYLMPSPDLNSFRAKTFLRWLLRSHLCISGLKLRDIWATRYGQFLFDELPYNSRLKKLILRFSFDLPVPTHITALLPKLRSLEELSCSASFQRTDALVDAVSALLRTTTCLTSLVFDASFHDNQREKTFLEALAANSTLKSLEVLGLSRNISRASLQLDISEPITTGFVVALSEVISDNYNLVEVSLFSLDVDAEATRSWFTIMDTTRRNSGLVNRAVVFKQSCPLDWYTATALEKVSRHPALLKVLAEKEGIAACDVARMVRSRLCSVDELHDFMRLSGVVKERVTCVPPIGDSSKQLADLHIDCWRVLRRYLSFDDVKRFAI